MFMKLARLKCFGGVCFGRTKQRAARHHQEHKGEIFSRLRNKSVDNWTRNVGAGMMIMRRETIHRSRYHNSACKNASVSLVAFCLDVKYAIQGTYNLMKFPHDVENV
jgi:hypothetical protein